MRNLIGPDILLVASLDLHANISKVMVDLASYLAICSVPAFDGLDLG
nr:M81 family metallopeptidase [Cohaesibacter gelatinilyticus]